MNVNAYFTMSYANLDAWRGQKTKPIQTQFNPKQTQFKANKAKNKPNSKPIWRKAKMNANAFTQVNELICLIYVADSNAAYYYHYDASGSVVALSNPDGDTHYWVNPV
ncbi:MAG: hypothetical protein FVQ84_09770 [Planctomycetes bacterium]|nr:hypothetical protein [Planctomycetota bacterium]